MKVRKAIEILAKCSWDAELRIDLRTNVAPSQMCMFQQAKRIKSVSSFTHNGKSVVTLNIGGHGSL